MPSLRRGEGEPSPQSVGVLDPLLVDGAPDVLALGGQDVGVGVGDLAGDAVLGQLAEDGGEVVGGEALVEVGAQVLGGAALGEPLVATHGSDHQTAGLANTIAVGEEDVPTFGRRLMGPAVSVAAMSRLESHRTFGHGDPSLR